MEIVRKISLFVLPCVVFLVALIILFGKKNYFSSFLTGAKSGFKGSISLLPSMCALIVSVSMFISSGAEKIISSFLSPLFDKIGVPSALFPLILLRPFSGSASIATYEEIISLYGADSFVGVCASVIMASSDTVIYVICMYFSTTKIRKTRHALPIALFISIFCVFLSCVVSRIFLNMI